MLNNNIFNNNIFDNNLFKKNWVNATYSFPLNYGDVSSWYPSQTPYQNENGYWCWLDKKNEGTTRDVQEGRGVFGSSLTNVCAIGMHDGSLITPTMRSIIRYKTAETLTAYSPLGGGSDSNGRRIEAYIDYSGKLRVFYPNTETTSTYVVSTITFDANQYYEFIIQWNGVGNKPQVWYKEVDSYTEFKPFNSDENAQDIEGNALWTEITLEESASTISTITSKLLWILTVGVSLSSISYTASNSYLGGWAIIDNNELIEYFDFAEEEAGGTTQTKHLGVRGNTMIIMNSDNTYRITDNLFCNFNNLYGYNDTEDNVQIPAELDSNGNATGLDVNGDALTYAGVVPKNLNIVGQNTTTFNGNNDEHIQFPNLIQYDTSEVWEIEFELIPTSITGVHLASDNTSSGYSRLHVHATTSQLGLTSITGASTYFSVLLELGVKQNIKYSCDGNHVITVSNNEDSASKTISATFELNNIGGERGVGTSYLGYSGIMTYAKFSKGDEIIEYKMAENNGSTVYDVSGNENHGTVNNAILDDFWTTSDLARPNNMLGGFDLWQNDTDSTYLYVPFDVNKNSIKADGDTITGYTWVSRNLAGSFHNGNECCFNMPKCPETVIPDLNQEYWFDTDQNIKDVCYNDKNYDVYDAGVSHHITLSNAEENKWRNIKHYKKPQDL